MFKVTFTKGLRGTAAEGRSVTLAVIQAEVLRTATHVTIEPNGDEPYCPNCEGLALKHESYGNPRTGCQLNEAQVRRLYRTVLRETGQTRAKDGLAMTPLVADQPEATIIEVTQSIWDASKGPQTPVSARQAILGDKTLAKVGDKALLAKGVPEKSQGAVTITKVLKKLVAFTYDDKRDPREFKIDPRALVAAQ